MWDVRKTLRDAIAGSGETDRSLSLKLGRNPSFIHDFLNGRSKKLQPDVKVEIAKVLGMRASKLAADAHEEQFLKKYDGLDPGAFEEDAEPYDPAPGSVLIRQPNVSLVRMKTNVLECHPLKIQAGQVLAFELSQAAVDAIDQVDPLKAIVICQLYDRDDLMKAETIVRQYVRPGLLITNRLTANDAYRLDDPSLPFEPRIKGVFRSLHWEA